MKVRSNERRGDAIAELKLVIIRQQELCAKLVRQGKRNPAQAARAELLVMLNQLDMLEHCSSQPSTPENAS
jgi:hypothetical protein